MAISKVMNSFSDDLVDTLEKKYEYEIELRDKVNRNFQFVKDYLHSLKERLRDVCEVSNGSIEITLDESDVIIARIKILNEEIIFKKEENAVVARAKRSTPGGQDIDHTIGSVDCESSDVDDKAMDQILEDAFGSAINKIKEES